MNKAMESLMSDSGFAKHIGAGMRDHLASN
jgi:hypothetical protein